MSAAEILDRLAATYTCPIGPESDMREVVMGTAAALDAGRWMDARDGAKWIADKLINQTGRDLVAAVAAETAEPAGHFADLWNATLAESADRYDD